jgi:hypothetical protein
MVGRKKDGKPQIIDVSDAKVRENARKLAGPADLNALFELGTLV